MNIFKKFTYLFAAVILCLYSCQKDNTIMYNNSTMGNIVNGQFISDQGNVFNIVEQTCTGDLMSMTRAFVVCDVLNKTEGGDSNEYDVRLTMIGSVLTKDIVPADGITTEMLEQDPMHVEYAWISGGYINLYVMFPIKVGSTTSHLVNLVHEGCMIDAETNAEISGTYRFSLRHNSYGDKIDPSQTVNYVMAGGYVSFPLNTFIKEKEADLSIEWVWHTALGEELTSELQVKSLTTKYSSESFQHTK
jgi:hypothetical protein